MCPQPYDAYTTEPCCLGREAFDEIDPAFVRLAAKQMQVWSEIDLTCTYMLAAMVKADSVVVSEMLEAMKSRVARDAGMDAAALICFDRNFYAMDIYKRVMSRVRSVEKQRSKYAHSQWGYCPARRDLFLLLHPRHMARGHAESLQWVRHFLQTGQEIDHTGDEYSLPLDDGKCPIEAYTKAEMEAAVRDAEETFGFLMNLYDWAERPDTEAGHEGWTALIEDLGFSPGLQPPSKKSTPPPRDESPPPKRQRRPKS